MTPLATTLLNAIDLHRSIEPDGRVLLEHVSLSLAAGDRLGLVGNSGSGKSTLLRALAMMDAPTSGQIHFLGKSIGDQDAPAYRRQVVHLPQQPGFIDGTVRENLQLAFRFESSQDAYDEAPAVHWITELGRDASMLTQSSSELSGGERQMIALVRALLLEPTVLLLDEPTSAMDEGLTDRLETIVRQWCESNSTRAFAWVSHDQRQLERVTNRRLHISGGLLHES